MEWSSILGAPLSIVGIIGVVAALQKAGVDIGGMLRSFLSVRDAETAHEASASLRNDFQKLLNAQQVLAQYFNHETTNELREIKEGLSKMYDKQDETNQALREILKYGIKCRKE